MKQEEEPMLMCLMGCRSLRSVLGNMPLSPGVKRLFEGRMVARGAVTA